MTISKIMEIGPLVPAFEEEKSLSYLDQLLPMNYAKYLLYTNSKMYRITPLQKGTRYSLVNKRIQ